MTIIRPHKQYTLLDKALIAAVGGLVAASAWLMMLYNERVDVSHGISEAQSAIQTREREIAELKEKIYALVASRNLEKLAETRGLVNERNPEYLETGRGVLSLNNLE